MTNQMTRRDVLRRGLAAGAAAVAAGPLRDVLAAEEKGAKMRFGLVTYLWAEKWDLPTIIKNCQATKVLGVELRTTHKHGVEPTLSPTERAEVKKRFADSPVTLVGLGTPSASTTSNPKPWPRPSRPPGHSSCSAATLAAAA